MASKPRNVLPDVDDAADAAAEAPTPGPDDVSRTMTLLAWGRKNGFRIGPEVTVGSVTIRVTDMRLAKREQLRGEQPDDDIMIEHGWDRSEDLPADGTTG